MPPEPESHGRVAHATRPGPIPTLATFTDAYPSPATSHDDPSPPFDVSDRFLHKKGLIAIDYVRVLPPGAVAPAEWSDPIKGKEIGLAAYYKVTAECYCDDTVCYDSNSIYRWIRGEGNLEDCYSKENGECGSAATRIDPTSIAPSEKERCTSGASLTPTNGPSATQWTWTCYGKSGGTSMECSAPKVATSTTSGSSASNCPCGEVTSSGICKYENYGSGYRLKGSSGSGISQCP